MTFTPSAVDEKAIATIRALAADVVANANSGHPGAPMGLAPLAHVLWSQFLSCDPNDSRWLNRDRFVLSNGHACALQYVMLHLLGYKVSLEDLKQFRQLDSRTPGHPEANHTDGIEVTTGPLGQGVAEAVGLAIAQRNAAATFNKDGFEVFKSHIYTIVGDGCLQEGVAYEALSLAGHLALDNLIVLYDDNHITIDGDTAVSFTEDVVARFESINFNILHVDNGDSDLAAIYDAIEKARQSTGKPTLIRVRTTIGYGSLKAGTASTHGSPLKPEDIAQFKEKNGLDPNEKFFVPEDVRELYKKVNAAGAERHAEWTKLFESYASAHADDHAEIVRRYERRLPEGWEKSLPTYKPDDAAVASRKLSETVLKKISGVLPELVGGSADLTGSNLTRWTDAVDFQPPATKLGEWTGRYIRYGVREHAMAAIMNGLHAFGLHIPTGGTFLNFVSYGIGAVRVAALSKFRVIFVATHDSIGLGEDGPTHQPIETAASLRAMPNLHFWRPADGNEVSGAYISAIRSVETPSVLALSRQNLPQLEGSTIENALRGGYVLIDNDEAAITLVATGSEVAIARDAVAKLADKGIKARLVSIPCFEVFDAQPLEYRKQVLPSGHPILSLEAYSTFGWGKYSHVHHGVNTFGKSAPAAAIYKDLGITDEAVAAKAAAVVEYYNKAGVKPISPVELEAAFE
ncbi:transketolase [Malassezia cuniculi]|uniref:Transketolase n=1 Tax=Malassezia cuniculi TaxID=948313 RepID=A0AAF0EWJ6_9BASI|nr:transketolase [Malassezia cuniculi]